MEQFKNYTVKDGIATLIIHPDSDTLKAECFHAFDHEGNPMGDGVFERDSFNEPVWEYEWAGQWWMGHKDNSRQSIYQKPPVEKPKESVEHDTNLLAELGLGYTKLHKACNNLRVYLDGDKPTYSPNQVSEIIKKVLERAARDYDISFHNCASYHSTKQSILNINCEDLI